GNRNTEFQRLTFRLDNCTEAAIYDKEEGRKRGGRVPLPRRWSILSTSTEKTSGKNERVEEDTARPSRRPDRCEDTGPSPVAPCTSSSLRCRGEPDFR